MNAYATPLATLFVELNNLNKNLNVILFAAALATSGCDRAKTVTPTGQVVATVDGQEITLEDLHAETGTLGANIGAGARKAIEQAALQQIISRTLIANYAKDQKLDATPVAAIIKRRAEQEALVAMVQQKLTAEVPAPSAEEAEIFIRDHPSSFSQRHVFVVDQITATDVPEPVRKALDNYTTLAEVQDAYARAGVKYNQTVGTIDALTIDADAAEKLASLPVGAVFISPEGNIMRVNHIREVVTAPVTGADATRIARETLQAQRATTLTQRQIASIVGGGMAKVRYNETYKPLKQEAGPAAVQ